MRYFLGSFDACRARDSASNDERSYRDHGVAEKSTVVQKMLPLSGTHLLSLERLFFYRFCTKTKPRRPHDFKQNRRKKQFNHKQLYSMRRNTNLCCLKLHVCRSTAQHRTLGESISGSSTSQPFSSSGSTGLPLASNTSGYHAASSLPTSAYGARTSFIVVNLSSACRKEDGLSSIYIVLNETHSRRKREDGIF